MAISLQDRRQDAMNLARHHGLQADGSGKAFERRFGRKRLSEPNLPRANILDVVGVTVAPLAQSSGPPSKMPVLEDLR
jgi:hypothetical protein